MCVYLSNIHDILICYGIFDIIVDKYGNLSISFYTILMIFCLFCCHVVFKYILKAFGLKKKCEGVQILNKSAFSLTCNITWVLHSPQWDVKNKQYSLDLLPCACPQVKHPQIFIVIELLAVRGRKLPSKYPHLPSTLGNYHCLQGDGESNRNVFERNDLC